MTRELSPMKCFFSLRVLRERRLPVRAGDDRHSSRLAIPSFTGSQLAPIYICPVPESTQLCLLQESNSIYWYPVQKSCPTHLNTVGAPLEICVYHLSTFWFNSTLHGIPVTGSHSPSNSFQHFYGSKCKDWYFLILFPHIAGKTRTAQFKSTCPTQHSCL